MLGCNELPCTEPMEGKFFLVFIFFATYAEEKKLSPTVSFNNKGILKVHIIFINNEKSKFTCDFEMPTLMRST